jgi:hypothetical protein
LSPEDEIRRADKAKQILESDAFKEAFSEVERVLLDGILRAPFKDSELREKLCQQYTALHTIRDQMRSYMESGQLAQATLAQRIKGAIFGQP